MATVHLPDSVQTEIQQIEEHIAHDSLDAALAIMESLHQTCASLENLPSRGAVYLDKYRRVFVGQYQIIYRVDMADVYILTVRHMRRKQPVL